jgi:hypothetical protein
VIRALVAAFIVAAGVGVTAADPMMPSGIYVIDGNTIEALGKRIRLVGFDARSSVSTPAAASSVCLRPARRRGCARWSS